MFTGIIEEIGTIKQIKQGRNSAVLVIHAKKVIEGTKVGDSIAVNGICLTVTSLFPGGFCADVMHETLKRSDITKNAPGRTVNLERAMPVNGRFGGHIVTGHVDGTGEIIGTKRDDTSVCYTIRARPELMCYIVEKGSVTIDGISLTVSAAARTDFSVSAIPHTISQTTLHERKKGDVVNLETDILAKYLEKLSCKRDGTENMLTGDFLSQHGF